MSCRTSVRFVLRMAVRETRAAWRRLVFFFLCVALGVGTIVALRSVIQSARGSLVREARSLLAADVAIQTTRPWTEALRAAIDRRHLVKGRDRAQQAERMQPTFRPDAVYAH